MGLAFGPWAPEWLSSTVMLTSAFRMCWGSMSGFAAADDSFLSKPCAHHIYIYIGSRRLALLSGVQPSLQLCWTIPYHGATSCASARCARYGEAQRLGAFGNFDVRALSVTRIGNGDTQ